jgi:uncharacterized membrane protein YtjA (UPF0391 family)
MTFILQMWLKGGKPRSLAHRFSNSLPPIKGCSAHGGIGMLGWAVTFLIIAIVAGLLGLTGIAGVAVQIAWTLFVIGIILFLVFFIMGRRSSVP